MSFTVPVVDQAITSYCFGSRMPSFGGREYINNSILCFDGYRSSGSRHIGQRRLSKMSVIIAYISDACIIKQLIHVEYSKTCFKRPLNNRQSRYLKEKW